MKTSKLLFFSLALSLILIPGMFININALDNNVDPGTLTECIEALCRDQLNALISLCNYSGISIPENFGGMEALKFVEATQKKFFNRKPAQERWQKQPLEWVNENAQGVHEALQTLGFFDSIFPMQIEYDAVCILGAAGGTMKNRIEFLEELIKNGLKTRKIVLLTGERYLTENVDGSAEYLSAVSKYFGVELEKLTETHLFKYLYEHSNLNGNFELIVIDTPQRNGCRPTTQTTLEDFLKWQRNYPDIHEILFISNQPSVKYQEAVIAEVLYHYKSELNFDVVGSGSRNIDLQRAVGELGAFIWAIMPQILRVLDFDKDKNFIELAQKLYGQQPIFYQGIFL